MQSRWLVVTAAAALALIACERSPVAPDVPVSWKTFAIEGSVRESIGLSVAPGTRVTGEITFNPDAASVFQPGNPALPRTESPDSIRYGDVAVKLTVGSNSISGNERAVSTIQILFGPPVVDVFRVDVPTGFSSGRIAERTIDNFTMALSILPSRWPDSSLPIDPAVFQAGLAQLNPGPFCLGRCTPPMGERILGNITAVR